jgi:hypothetical protein
MRQSSVKRAQNIRYSNNPVRSQSLNRFSSPVRGCSAFRNDATGAIDCLHNKMVFRQSRFGFRQVQKIGHYVIGKISGKSISFGNIDS